MDQQKKKSTHLYFRYRGWETDAANRNSGVSLKLHYNKIRLEHVTRPPHSTVCSKTHETSAFLVGLSFSATNTLSFYTDYCCYMSETAGGVDKQTEIKNILDL